MNNNYVQNSPPSDVWFGHSQHVNCGFVELDEDTVVDLPQTEKLEDFSGFRMKTVDTEINRKNTGVTRLSCELLNRIL